MQVIKLPDPLHRQVLDYSEENNLTLEEACKELILKGIKIRKSKEESLSKHLNVFSIRASK
jgi:hypothetical protein